MKSLGGFFGLEMTQHNQNYHHEALALTSGRACFNFILQKIQASKIYIPYYICDAALIPLKKQNIAFEFYAINQALMPSKILSLKKNEYIVYVNYFGLMNSGIEELYHLYRDHLIIDNTQAFFEKNYQDCWSFNSARKFFGVPDGGYLYSSNLTKVFDKKNYAYNLDISYKHLIERLLEHPHAYQHYQESELAISADILKMSTFSHKILSTINYNAIIEKRNNNYAYLENKLSKKNLLAISNQGNTAPFCYPLLLNKSIDRNYLAQKNIFIPIYWKDVLNRQYSEYGLEKKLSAQLLPLPVDHRYNSWDYETILEILSDLKEV